MGVIVFRKIENGAVHKITMCQKRKGTKKKDCRAAFWQSSRSVKHIACEANANFEVFIQGAGIFSNQNFLSHAHLL